MVNIRVMTAGDLALGMRLKTIAGWNQTPRDWERFLALGGEGCFVAEFNGKGIGTATTAIFGPSPRVGWIAMVLVDPESRGQGTGTALMRQCLAHLDAQGVEVARLDATPLGRPIYEKLGFKFEYDLQRHDGTLSPQSRAAPQVRAFQPGDLDTILRLDREATGTPREALIKRLISDNLKSTWVHDAGSGVDGYITTRPGSSAVFVGPCVAGNAAAGVALLDAAAQHHAGTRCYIDIPIDNAPAVAWAGRQGLKVQRPLHRMSRGGRVTDHPAQLFASSGPEMG